MHTLLPSSSLQCPLTKPQNSAFSPFQFSSVQFSMNIYIAQLSRMSHCAPEATLNPIRLLKFSPETVVSNVFVAQVCWEAVPDTWPGNSKAPVANCNCSTKREDFVTLRKSIKTKSQENCLSRWTMQKTENCRLTIIWYVSALLHCWFGMSIWPKVPLGGTQQNPEEHN